MTIEIKGKQIKFGFGLYFLGKAQKKFDTDLQGLLNGIIKNPISDSMDLMYYSAVCEAELDEVELPIKKRDLIDFLEESGDLKSDKGHLANWTKGLMETIRGNFLPEKEPEPVEEGTAKKK